MSQEILIKRSKSVYASESLAWGALDTHTFKKGEPIAVYFTKEGNAHGDSTTAAIYAIGTNDGVGKYQAFATFEDFYSVYLEVQKLKDYWTFDKDKNALITKYNIIVEGGGSFGEEGTGGGGGGGSSSGGSSYLSDLNDVRNDGSGNVVDASGNPATVGSLFTFDGTKWYAITRDAVARSMKSTLVDEGMATTSYVDEAIQDAKDTRVDTLINTTIPSLEEDIQSAQNAANTAQGTANTAKSLAEGNQSKINTLIGSDTDKSVRDISKLAVAELLEGADADFDTLIEIANYLESHSTDAIAMSNAIEALKKISKTFYNNGTVTEDSIKTYIDNAVKALEDGKVATAIANISVLQARKISAGAGLTGGGDLSSDRTISLGTPSTITGSTTNSASGTTHTHAIDAASTTKKGIVQLNDAIDSTSATQAGTANAVKKAYDKAASAQTDLDILEAKTLTSGTATEASGTLSSGAKVDVKYDNSSIKVNASNQLYIAVIDGGTF